VVSGVPTRSEQPPSGDDLPQIRVSIVSASSSQNLVFEHGILLPAHQSSFVLGVHSRRGCSITMFSLALAATINSCTWVWCQLFIVLLVRIVENGWEVIWEG